MNLAMKLGLFGLASLADAIPQSLADFQRRNGDTATMFDLPESPVNEFPSGFKPDGPPDGFKPPQHTPEQVATITLFDSSSTLFDSSNLELSDGSFKPNVLPNKNAMPNKKTVNLFGKGLPEYSGTEQLADEFDLQLDNELGDEDFLDYYYDAAHNGDGDSKEDTTEPDEFDLELDDELDDEAFLDYYYPEDGEDESAESLDKLAFARLDGKELSAELDEIASRPLDTAVAEEDQRRRSNLVSGLLDEFELELDDELDDDDFLNYYYPESDHEWELQKNLMAEEEDRMAKGSIWMDNEDHTWGSIVDDFDIADEFELELDDELNGEDFDYYPEDGEETDGSDHDELEDDAFLDYHYPQDGEDAINLPDLPVLDEAGPVDAPPLESAPDAVEVTTSAERGEERGASIADVSTLLESLDDITPKEQIADSFLSEAQDVLGLVVP